MRDMIKKTNDYYDERTCSLSDYSVMIKNIPKQIGTERIVRNFMQKGFTKKEEELVVPVAFKI